LQPVPGVRPARAERLAVRDSTLVAWYRSLYAPHAGGAYDSHHRTAGIAGRTRAKCLQLLIESVPTLNGLGVLWDPSTGSLQLKAVEAAAQGFGISAQVFETRRAADIAEAFYAVDRSRIQGVS